MAGRVQGHPAAATVRPTAARRIEQGEMAMPDATRCAEADPDDGILQAPLAAMRQIVDNPFLLLFIGVATPTVLDVLWGVIDILSVPVVKY